MSLLIVIFKENKVRGFYVFVNINMFIMVYFKVMFEEFFKGKDY